MGRILKLTAILFVLFSTVTVSAEEQTGSITVYLENTAGTVTVYQTDNWSEDDPDQLSAVVKERHIQGISRSVIPGTLTVFAELSPGKYLVTHEDNAFRPFLVTIPMTVNGSITFAVEARPKTQDIQSPQTGDPINPWYLGAAVLASLMGVAGIAYFGLPARKSSADGRMFLKRIQNRQKRLP